jgi:hypothetical protein
MALAAEAPLRAAWKMLTCGYLHGTLIEVPDFINKGKFAPAGAGPLCEDSAAVPGYGRSGCFSATALDQENKSDCKQDA